MESRVSVLMDEAEHDACLSLTLAWQPSLPPPLLPHQQTDRPTNNPTPTMADAIYDQIEIEDMTFDPALQIYHYPCPCGDRFEISIDDLRDGENIAVCPSCSLMIEVVFEPVCISSQGVSEGC